MYMCIGMFVRVCGCVCVCLCGCTLLPREKTERLGLFLRNKTCQPRAQFGFSHCPQGTIIPVLKLSTKSATTPMVPDGTHELPRGRGHQDVSCKR